MSNSANNSSLQPAFRRRVTAIVYLAVLVATVGLAAASEPHPRGRLIEDVACASDPSQTYTLYLPRGYDDQKDRDDQKRWPLMMIFDPRGRSVMAAELFLPAAERFGWILMSSDNTRSDGLMDPNFKAVNAMLPDAMERYGSDPRRIYAAGFSGGAMLAWMVGTRSGLLAGVIAAGGRVIPDVDDDDATWACFGTVGSTDFNYLPMRRVHEIIERRGSPNRLEVFDGRHSWMPESLAMAGMEWMELLAMRRGHLTIDKELVSELFTKDEALAEDLEESGRPLVAMRRWQAIAATFEGLRDVTRARERGLELAGEKAVKRALKDERGCEGTERRYLERFSSVILGFESGEEPYPSARLANALGIADLQRQAEKDDGCAAVTAQRLLETTFTQTSFYLPRRYLEEGRDREAVAVLKVAARIKEELPHVWFKLASAQGRLGDLDEAFAALAKAIEYGYDDVERHRAAPELEPLRADARFEAMMRAVEGSDDLPAAQPPS